MFFKIFMRNANNQRFWIISRRSSKLAYIHQTGNIPLRYETMGQQVQRSAVKYAKRIALKSCYEQTELTFEEAYEEAAAMTVKLNDLGLKQGEHMAVWAPNTKQWYITFLASALGGFPLVCLNHALQRRELQYSLDKAKVKLLVTMDSYSQINFLSTLQEVNKNELQIIMKTQQNVKDLINYDEWLNAKPDSLEISNLTLNVRDQQPENPCSIQFTSGTTGQPKAALTSNFNIINESIYMGKVLKLDHGPKIVCLTVPMFHAFGFSVISAALNFGSTLCLPSPTFNAESSLEAIERHKCQVIMGTPTMFVDLVDTQKRLRKNTSSLELALMGGSACSPEVLQRTKQVFEIPDIRVGYGLSEVSGAIFANDGSESPTKAFLTCGKLCPHGEAKIVDDSGNTLKFGEVGELLVRGWFTMLGYFGDEINTRKTIDTNGWLQTGDKFILESDGAARYQGRKKDIIIRGGENIFPKEIEDYLDKHPSILESQIIGVPHQRLGEEVCVYLRLKHGVKPLTLEDIIYFCKGELAYFKVPKHVRMVEEFPKTASGKIQKYKLQQMFKNE